MHITTELRWLLLPLAGIWAWKRSGKKNARKREARAARKRLVELNLLG